MTMTYLVKFEKSLEKLFSKNRKLRFLELDYERNILTTEFLLKMPLDQINTLKIGLRGENLINILKHTENLSNFHYCFKDTSESTVLKSISIYLSNLTKIELKFRDPLNDVNFIINEFSKDGNGQMRVKSFSMKKNINL